MTIEQVQGIAWLIIGIVFGAAMFYAMWRRKLKFPVYRVWLVLLFIFMFVADSFEGRGLGALFVWAAGIIGLSIVLDVLAYRGKELNEKLAAISTLIVIVVGGILTNAYVFLTPTSVTARIFSLVVFTLLTLPIVFGLIAYLKGKKELSKKFTSIGFYSEERKNEA